MDVFLVTGMDLQSVHGVHPPAQGQLDIDTCDTERKKQGGLSLVYQHDKSCR